VKRQVAPGQQDDQKAPDQHLAHQLPRPLHPTIPP
jgi:hypothetical protein